MASMTSHKIVLITHVFATIVQLLSFATFFVTKIGIVPHGTLITNAFTCKCNYGKVPTNIIIIDVTMFHACGMD
jgi:hypothetical protein